MTNEREKSADEPSRTQSSTTPKQKKAGGKSNWATAESQEGKTYYYNTETGVAWWDKPVEDTELQQLASPPPTARNTRSTTREEEISDATSNNSGQAPEPSGVMVVSDGIGSGASSELTGAINVEPGVSKRRDCNALLGAVEQAEEDPNILLVKEHESACEEQRPEKALNDDIYSLMYISKMGYGAFWFAMAAFFTQAVILCLIFYDLVNLEHNPPLLPNGKQNRFNIPPGTELTVTCAQFFGVGLTVYFVASGGDLFKGLEFLFNGYDYDIAREIEGATRFKWAMAGVLQVLVGIVMTIDSLLLMMQSTSVIDMCLNFAALHFVQDIDDWAFQVAANGLVSRRVQAECDRVGEVMIKATLKSRTQLMRRIVMTVMLLGLYTVFFFIVAEQWSGRCRCTALNIQFGDHYFPELAYYSGRFESDEGFPFPLSSSRHSQRPIFYDPSRTIKLRYSRSETAWLIQKKTSDGPDYMLKSSETKTFDVSTISMSTWFANTDSGDLPVDFISLTCADCIVSRCNPDHGACEDNKCNCKEDRIGEFCQAEDLTCQYLALDLRTKSAVANIPGGSFFYDNQFRDIGSSDIMDSPRVLDRKIYVPYKFAIYNWMAFTGRRWAIFGPQTVSPSAELNLTDVFSFLNFTRNHKFPEAMGLLSEEQTYRPIFFSSPVDFGTTSYGFDPTSVTWVFAQPIQNNSLAPDNIFGFGPNDDNPVPAKFLCSDCNQGASCGSDGQCDDFGSCMCLPFYDGSQCEYVHSCNELGCFNGGTCNELTGGCENCIPDANGTLCQFPLPPKIKENKYFCRERRGEKKFGQCENKQKCNGIEMKCECEEPFYGEHCEQSTQANCSVTNFATSFILNFTHPEETKIFEPYPNRTEDPCKNGGHCDWYLEWPICRCRDPYRGDFCQLGPPEDPTAPEDPTDGR